jgi:transposase
MPENTSPTVSTPLPDFAAFVGLDWGDEKHALSLCAVPGPIERSELEQVPEALADWANGLRRRFPNGKIAICLEQARGALISALIGYDHLVPFPVNPKMLGRSKDDPIDGDLLLELILKHRQHLRAWQPDTVQTRQLALLTEQRRGFVDSRTGLTNQLLAHLKAIFPQAVFLVGDDLASRMATDFLQKWPTLQDVQKVKPATLRKFYYGHNSRTEKLIAERLDKIKTAVALTADPALLAAHSLGIQTLVAQLAALRPFIEQHDEQIAELFAAHPDAPIFDSLPGAGAVLAPRLLTSLGTDRGRFVEPVAVSCYTGIAPVTEKSGKSQHWVHVRWSCPKFVRQSWHEFANSSRHYCNWAKACYEEWIKKMDHHEAIRKLAYKWQRVVWRMWQDRKPYDDALYVRALQKRGIALAAALPVPSVETGEQK